MRDYTSLRRDARAPRSWAAYDAAGRRFVRFLNTVRAARGVTPFSRFDDVPLSAAGDPVNASFMVWLATDERLAPGTIRQSVQGVMALFEERGVPRFVFRGSLSETVAAGISRRYGQARRGPARPPLTMGLMSRIRAALDRDPGSAHPLSAETFWCILTWSFFGLFRPGELVACSDGRSQGLLASDVSRGHGPHPGRSCWTVRVRRSKTDRGGRGAEVLLAENLEAGPSCPARAGSAYAAWRDRLRRRRSEGFFLLASGDPVTTAHYAAALRAVTAAAGIPERERPRQHSGRIGGASAAVAAGASDIALRAGGRWRSDPVALGYVRQSVEGASVFQHQMARGRRA